MENRFSVYFTYLLANTNYGYSTPIHCNYIKSIDLETLTNQEVNIFFENESDFKFLSPTTGTTGLGYMANKIYMIVQVVQNQPVNMGGGVIVFDRLSPRSDRWRIFDVSNQVSGYTTGNTQSYLTAKQLTTNVFSVPLTNFEASGQPYNLDTIAGMDYIGYPHSGDTNVLSFGDETFFLGNVESDIAAIVHTTDLAINLPLNQFNSTTNPTWNAEESVLISEVGIFNENREMVAIGKFNNPIEKNSQTSRTILFNIDF